MLNEIEAEGPENLSAVTAIRLLMLTGCRLNEIQTLRWEDVDLDAGELRLPDSKTGEKLTGLPPAPFEACDKAGTRVSSLSLVRYRDNDYSVPVAYGHQEVWVLESEILQRQPSRDGAFRRSRGRHEIDVLFARQSHVVTGTVM